MCSGKNLFNEKDIWWLGIFVELKVFLGEINVDICQY